MRMSDWSSDVCSSYLCGAKSSWLKPLLQVPQGVRRRRQALESRVHARPTAHHDFDAHQSPFRYLDRAQVRRHLGVAPPPLGHHRPAGETARRRKRRARAGGRSEEHTSELQSLMRISYAVFCLKKKINTYQLTTSQPVTITTELLHKTKHMSQL